MNLTVTRAESCGWGGFRRFYDEGVEFFKSDFTDPLRFLMRIFWKYQLTLTRPIGLPPNAPVAQKSADKRWLIADSAKK